MSAYRREWRERNKDKYKEWFKRYNREWYLKNKDKKKEIRRLYILKNREKILAYKRKDSRRYMLDKRYGLTVEQFDEMVFLQNNCCAICSTKFKNAKDTNIDHCHKTGKIRDLLCFKCNVGIGRLNDSIELLEKAIEYLKKHNGIRTNKL